MLLNYSFFHIVGIFVVNQIFKYMLTKSLKIKDHTTGKKRQVKFKAGRELSNKTGKQKKKVKFKAGADLQGKTS